MFLFCSELKWFWVFLSAKARARMTRKRKKEREISHSVHATGNKQPNKNWHHTIFLCICISVVYGKYNSVIVYTLSFHESSFHSFCLLCSYCSFIRFVRVQSFGMIYASAFGSESCARMFKCPEVKQIHTYTTSHMPHKMLSLLLYNKNKHAFDKTDQRINNNTAVTYIRSDFCTTLVQINRDISVCDSMNIAFKWLKQKQLKNIQSIYFF